MRSNAMKSCAVGAMVVGGALSMTQTASAGLTWISDIQPQNWRAVNYASVFIPNTFPPVVFHDVEYAPAWNATSGSYQNFATVSYSATTAAGFSTSLTHNGLFAGTIVAQVVRLFAVTGPTAVSFSLTEAGSGYVQYTLWNITTGQAVVNGSNPSSFSWSGTLAAGTYSLAMELQTDAGGAAYSGQVFSFVPAPGAIAMLGAAGLVSGRRRRA
jgi:hypothetical protein